MAVPKSIKGQSIWKSSVLIPVFLEMRYVMIYMGDVW